MPPDPGWRVFPSEARLAAWLGHVRPHAERAVAANGEWLRHDGTWFAGVDVLPNDPDGRVAGGPPLACAALEAAGRLRLHKGQVSVTYPGYPGRDSDESAAAHRFRRDRDAAHLDGLLPVGPDRRRMIREPHAWILGLPLSPMRRTNAPLVVWEGSQDILRAALVDALAGYPPEAWPDIDVTEAYQAARRRCFDVCARVEIEAMPGEAILLHRLILAWRGAVDGASRATPFGDLLPADPARWHRRLACHVTKHIFDEG